MCGICGYTGPETSGLLDQMMEAIRHRGPDSGGSFVDRGIHLGNRRLRILDLDGGDQPISNEDGTITLVYNGEIYNHRELRSKLEARGHRFDTDTDTEIIVHLYEEYGASCAEHLNGMFAFALWDAPRRRLLIVRDPVGIKPLVYSWKNGVLVFASEAKSVLQHPAVSADLDPDALHQLLNVRFVPGPATLFRGISQLPPGCLLLLENGELHQHRYHRWDFPGDTKTTMEDAADGFLHCLERAVERQMVADVPLGIFLSGGLDSSSILTAATASQGSEGLRTFSLGFNEPTDELADARLMASHVGSEHYETTLSAQPLELFPRIVYHAECPKVNAAQGYYLSRFARQHVTVALSGLGGDELFYGYQIYRCLWPGRLLTGSPLAGFFSAGSGVADGVATAFDRLAGPRGDNPRRVFELLASGDDPLRYYVTLRNGWDLRLGAANGIYTESWLKQISLTTREAFAPYFDRPDLPLAEQVQWAEFRAKMVDDFLANEDRMSMANSLEVRVPLLDLEMVNYAFSLPYCLKHRAGGLKPIMKRAMAPLLPPAIMNKKKWGFTFDSYEQFRKDLQLLCHRELDRSFIESQGIFRHSFIDEILQSRPSPRMRWHYFVLWMILGLKFWQEIFLEGRSWQEIEERIRR
ncbi:MAG: asparagine synthase (glutamine-hydrolyzing) [bacterium]|nr:asparagine synthase (glutamine-hydrolyzing) [bacterium]